MLISCHPQDLNMSPPDNGHDTVSTRPCFNNKNLSQPTSLSLCLHITASLFQPSLPGPLTDQIPFSTHIF